MAAKTKKAIEAKVRDMLADAEGKAVAGVGMTKVINKSNAGTLKEVLALF